jgi:hypothetical protein
MRSILLIFLCLLAFISLRGQLKNSSLPKSYYAKQIARPMVIDGKISPNEWDHVPWSDDYLDIEGDKEPTPKLKTRMKITWDEEFLYVLAEMEEPHLWATLKDYDAIVYQDHDFEIFIDPDDDGNDYIEIEINTLGTVMDLHMSKPYSRGGPMDMNFNTVGMKTAVGVNGTINKNDDIDNGWVVEFAIPFSSMSKGEKKYGPTPERPWRVNFSRVEWKLDFDGLSYKKKLGENNKPLPEYNWVWTPQGVINMHVPEKWGYLYFTK